VGTLFIEHRGDERAKISDPGKDITSFHNDLAALNRGGRTRVGGATRRAGSRKKGSGCTNPSRAVERANFLGACCCKMRAENSPGVVPARYVNPGR
jgi:hypothetical protein